jgi:hypothetical protein
MTRAEIRNLLLVEITEPSNMRAAPNFPYALTSENAQQVACGGSLHSGNTFWKN